MYDCAFLITKNVIKDVFNGTWFAYDNHQTYAFTSKMYQWQNYFVHATLMNRSNAEKGRLPMEQLLGF